jgi:hypothetical protein
MNNNYISPQYHAHKKRLQTDDLELSTFGLPRKKFVSEESFTKEMAAMSLDTGKFLIIDKQRKLCVNVYINRFATKTTTRTEPSSSSAAAAILSIL